MKRCLPGLASACALLIALPCHGQQSDRANDPRTIVIPTPADVTTPIPTVNDGGTNGDLVNLLFLRLAELGPSLATVGDRGFRPVLARQWRRPDSVTLVFDLDPRATWHDGKPVTSADVVFSYNRAMEVSDFAQALRRVASVTADGARRVVFKFRTAYGEQFFDVTQQLHIAPAHLLAGIPRDSLPASAFARHPVGNGAFRWVRNVPGQFIELEANPQFFLGAPGIKRVIFRIVRDPEARVSMLLSGEADVLQFLSLTAEARARSHGSLEVVPVISPTITYALFNQRANGDRSKPHPILSDIKVRRALLLALDREAMVRATYGGHARVTDGPVPQTFAWVGIPAHRPAPPDRARARALLAEAGWRDSDADGTLDRNGVPFELTVNAPNSTPQRPMMAQQMQAQFLEIGVKLNVQLLDFGVWRERRDKGEFDIDMSSANMDPTPSGWNWSWSCNGVGQNGRNVGGYCNPRIDSLLERANASRQPIPIFRQILGLIREDVPAVFLAAPSMVVAVDKRFSTRPFRSESTWLSLREWKVREGSPSTRGRGAD